MRNTARLRAIEKRLSSPGNATAPMNPYRNASDAELVALARASGVALQPHIAEQWPQNGPQRENAG